MPLTNSQYNRILARLTAMEERVNDILVATQAFISRTQINQLQVIQETEQQALREQLNALEKRVSSLESEPIS